MIDPLSLLIALLVQYWPLWLAFMLLNLLGALAKSPGFKGWIGEVRLDRTLRKLPAQRYHLIGNLTLPTADGSTQLDHVLVSPHGVFVIETKNFGGWIFGKAHEKMWTQKFPRRSSSFQNPLRQNYKHVRTLAELTGVDEAALFSLVVFVGTAEFKTAMPPNVVKLSGCRAAIEAHTAQLLDEAEVARVLARIQSTRLAPGWRTHAMHVRHVKQTVEARQAPRAVAPPSPHAPVDAPAPEVATVSAPAAAEAFPRCGGKLDVLTYRSGPKLGASFQGCLRFPACSYRLDLPAAAREAAIS